MTFTLTNLFNLRFTRIGMWAAMVFGAACASDGSPPELATVVTPMYSDPCSMYSCSGLGECVQPIRDGAPTCDCSEGYAGLHCDKCTAGYHRDALSHCLPDQLCSDQKQNPCGSYGQCDDADGVIACTCMTGYVGARCHLCAPSYERIASGECLLKMLESGGSRASDRD